MTTSSLHTPDQQRAPRTPYAGPVADASVGSAASVVGHDPYVPAALRSRPTMQASLVASLPQHAERSPEETSVAQPRQVSNTPLRNTPLRNTPLRNTLVSDTTVSDTTASDTESQPASQEAEALPWINAFLAPEPVEPPVSDERDRAERGGAFVSEAERADDWPFSDAGAAASELSSELSSREPFAEPLLSSAPESLPMWNDDDMMDIMPVRATDPVPEAEAAAPESADRRAAAELQQESAARALETLATRVRGGDLVLPGYAPEMGDAAALAAALAALLGSRR